MRCCRCKSILWFIVSVIVTYWFYAKFLRKTDCDLFRLAVIESMDSGDDYDYDKGGSDYNINDRRMPKKKKMTMTNETASNKRRRKYLFNYKMPLVFIGGVRGAGLTLMRAIIDAHPDIRCGEDTSLISAMLVKRQEWTASKVERERLFHAGMHDTVIDSAVRSFILELVVKQGRTARILCNKDPEIVMHVPYAKQLFPNAKFLFVVRDGRANANTIVQNGIQLSGHETKTYEQALSAWNKLADKMIASCRDAGQDTCLPVFYEELVLFPAKVVDKLVKFLNVSHSDNLLHHEKFLDNILTSNRLVSEPLHANDLYSWVSNVPSDLSTAAKMDQVAPMLQKIGYDISVLPPNYKKLFEDPFEAEFNNMKEKENEQPKKISDN